MLRCGVKMMDNFPELPLDPPEPRVLCKCHFCGEDIFEGEVHWIYNGWHVHLNHFEDPDTIKGVKEDNDLWETDGRE